MHVLLPPLLLLAAATAQDRLRPEPPAGQPDATEAAATAAIDRGLAWLARHQDEDGRWSAALFVRHDPAGDVCQGTGKPDQDLAVTSFAMLAGLAAGSTLRGGPFREPLRRAVEWMRSLQGESGGITDPAAGDLVVPQALAAFALTEATGLSNQQVLMPVAGRAMAALVARRLPDGSWPRSARDGEGDREATFWAGIAAASARTFNVAAVDVRVLPELMPELANPAPALPDAAVAFVLEFSGFTGRPPFDVAADLPRWPEAGSGPADPLDWLYRTWFLRSNGDVWPKWSEHVVAMLANAQRPGGAAEGSWDPVDVRGKQGGRVQSTALHLTTLAWIRNDLRMRRSWSERRANREAVREGQPGH
ncbi:MAG: terpene cyclase/mutase family protein [Planctomycetes bacterium]|nr:terpene cyclase/mutase family protein [Planctomycetota bacterium]